jgi:cystathionine beta-synthase
MVQVEDRESFLMTRKLLTSEGIYSGVSSGSAFVGTLRWLERQGDRMDGKNVLIIFPDSGDRYASKVYDDDWMREAGFLESKVGNVKDLMQRLEMKPGNIIMARPTDKISAVIARLSEAGISQIPIADENGWVKGIVRESTILKAIFNKQVHVADSIDSLVDTSIEFVTPGHSIDKISKLVTEGKVPLITDPDDGDSLLGIITDIDLLNYLGSRNAS